MAEQQSDLEMSADEEEEEDEGEEKSGKTVTDKAAGRRKVRRVVRLKKFFLINSSYMIHPATNSKFLF